MLRVALSLWVPFVLRKCLTRLSAVLGEDFRRQPNQARDKSRGFNRGAHLHRQCQHFSGQPTVSAICALTTQRIDDRWDEVDGAVQCTISGFGAAGGDVVESVKPTQCLCCARSRTSARSFCVVHQRQAACGFNQCSTKSLGSFVYTRLGASTEQIETTFGTYQSKETCGSARVFVVVHPHG